MVCAAQAGLGAFVRGAVYRVSARKKVGKKGHALTE